MYVLSEEFQMGVCLIPACELCPQDDAVTGGGSVLHF